MFDIHPGDFYDVFSFVYFISKRKLRLQKVQFGLVKCTDWQARKAPIGLFKAQGVFKKRQLTLEGTVLSEKVLSVTIVYNWLDLYVSLSKGRLERHLALDALN